MPSVIFGSAASPATRDRARDVDVAYTGDREDAMRLASAWAHAHGLGGLPLDVHEASSRTPGEVRIPSPYGIDVPAIPLTPDTIVQVDVYRTVAAAVRAFGHRPGILLPRRLPKSSRLTVVPVEHDAADWEGYVAGLGALRRAVAKAPRPDAVTRVLTRAYGHLLGRLLTEDPRPSEDGLAELRSGSPVAAGGAVILLLIQGQPARLPYGRVAPERVEGLLYPHVSELPSG